MQLDEFACKRVTFNYKLAFFVLLSSQILLLVLLPVGANGTAIAASRGSSAEAASAAKAGDSARSAKSLRAEAAGLRAQAAAMRKQARKLTKKGKKAKALRLLAKARKLNKQAAELEDKAKQKEEEDEDQDEGAESEIGAGIGASTESGSDDSDSHGGNEQDHNSNNDSDDHGSDNRVAVINAVFSADMRSVIYVSDKGLSHYTVALCSGELPKVDMPGGTDYKTYEIGPFNEDIVWVNFKAGSDRVGETFSTGTDCLDGEAPEPTPPTEDPVPPVEDPVPPAEDPAPPVEDPAPPVEDPETPNEDPTDESQEQDPIPAPEPPPTPAPGQGEPPQVTPDVACGKGAASEISYSPQWPTGGPGSNLDPGTAASVTFRVKQGCLPETFTLASYRTTTPQFSLPQILDNYETKLVSSADGAVTMTARVPNDGCYQLDFVHGDVIVDLSTKLYGDKKIAWANGRPGCNDVCPNITGTQTTVPEGMLKDEEGKCVQPPPPPKPDPIETKPDPAICASKDNDDAYLYSDTNSSVKLMNCRGEFVRLYSDPIVNSWVGGTDLTWTIGYGTGTVALSGGYRIEWTTDEYHMMNTFTIIRPDGTSSKGDVWLWGGMGGSLPKRVVPGLKAHHVKEFSDAVYRCMGPMEDALSCTAPGSAMVDLSIVKEVGSTQVAPYEEQTRFNVSGNVRNAGLFAWSYAHKGSDSCAESAARQLVRPGSRMVANTMWADQPGSVYFDITKFNSPSEAGEWTLCLYLGRSAVQTIDHGALLFSKPFTIAAGPGSLGEISTSIDGLVVEGRSKSFRVDVNSKVAVNIRAVQLVGGVECPASALVASRMDGSKIAMSQSVYPGAAVVRWGVAEPSDEGAHTICTYMSAMKNGPSGEFVMPAQTSRIQFVAAPAVAKMKVEAPDEVTGGENPMRVVVSGVTNAPMSLYVYSTNQKLAACSSSAGGQATVAGTSQVGVFNVGQSSTALVPETFSFEHQIDARPGWQTTCAYLATSPTAAAARVVRVNRWIKSPGSVLKVDLPANFVTGFSSNVKIDAAVGGATRMTLRGYIESADKESCEATERRQGMREGAVLFLGRMVSGSSTTASVVTPPKLMDRVRICLYLSPDNGVDFTERKFEAVVPVSQAYEISQRKISPVVELGRPLLVGYAADPILAYSTLVAVLTDGEQECASHPEAQLLVRGSRYAGYTTFANASGSAMPMYVRPGVFNEGTMTMCSYVGRWSYQAGGWAVNAVARDTISGIRPTVSLNLKSASVKYGWLATDLTASVYGTPGQESSMQITTKAFLTPADGTACAPTAFQQQYEAGAIDVLFEKRYLSTISGRSTEIPLGDQGMEAPAKGRWRLCGSVSELAEVETPWATLDQVITIS